MLTIGVLLMLVSLLVGSSLLWFAGVAVACYALGKKAGSGR